MDFGRLDTSELHLVDFAFAKDNSKAILNGSPAETKFYIGLGQKGKLTWPAYLKCLNAIEFSGSYYGMPTVESTVKDYDKYPENFKVNPKMPQIITHTKRLNNVDDDLKAFEAAISLYNDKFGRIIIMPYPTLKRQDKQVLITLLEKLTLPAALELRHESWYEEGYDQDLLAVLNNRDIATIITDTPGRRDAVHMQLSGPSVFIRFVSCSDPVIDQRRLHTWKLKLEDWKSKGLQECYFMLHADLDTYALAMAEGMSNSLIIKPKEGQIGLF